MNDRGIGITRNMRHLSGRVDHTGCTNGKQDITLGCRIKCLLQGLYR